MNSKITLKELSPEDRPREKMILKGRNSLSDSELLAIIIGSGSRTKTALDLSREILMYCNNNVNQLSDLSYFDLIKFKGVGEAKAVSILAALEFSHRGVNSGSIDKVKVKQSSDVYQFLKRDFSGLKHEECYIVLLNRANVILNKFQISKGGVSGTVVDAKIIFKIAIDNNASSIILAHNHPSGSLLPSEQDKLLTQKVKSFGKMIDLPLLDHLILTNNGYFSFLDNGEF
jgi:DNA repair protein RadC